MLFNSYEFIFGFLPVVLGGYFWFARSSQRAAVAWLFAASVFFYGWWNPAYVALLLLSICFNYACGVAIVRSPQGSERQRALLIFAVAVDVIVLGWYKYANFFAAGIGKLSGSEFSPGDIVLPLGISFFTFTQIAYLADVYYGKVRDYNFVRYGLFVTYFPHLIAGPILHHAEMMPQFARRETGRPSAEDAAVGITLFAIGLFKKVIFADGVGAYAKPVFDAAAAGIELGALEAWCGVLAYTLQLYFDFSGYSDMAVGASRLFGIVLPLNFYSPYKAANIIEFWRRWHMTLSRFLRDYLYIPLGGNRHGNVRRYSALMVTMILGGLWHGAGVTFVVWGTLHGVYLAINHAWRGLRLRCGQDLSASSRGGRACGCLLTFLAVVVGWVFFRSADLGTARRMLEAMAGCNGVALPDSWLQSLGATGAWMQAHGVRFRDTHDLVRRGALNWIWILLIVVWGLPNSQQILSRYRSTLDRAGEEYRGRFVWRPTPFVALLVALAALTAIFNFAKHSEFLYFQF